MGKDRFIVRRNIDKEFINLAEEYTLKHSLNRSITNGERNLMSTIAELYYIDMIDSLKLGTIDYTLSTDYDINFGGLKIDVKAKQRTVEPKPDYMASIVAYSKLKQKCEYYAFCQITVDKIGNFKDFYYIGSLSKKRYFSISDFKKKGEPDGNNFVNGKAFKIREDCYNLEYSKLNFLNGEDVQYLKNKFDIIRW